MAELSSNQAKSSPARKTLLVTLGSGIIYLSMLAAGIAGVVALFRHTGANESFVTTFSRGFFRALYFPTASILAVAIVGVVVFAAIKFFAGGGSDSAKITITFFIVLLFVLIGSAGSLIHYRPEPTTAYLIVFGLLTAPSLALHIYLVVKTNTPSPIEKVRNGLLVTPYVILSIFSAMSLVLAMVLSIKTPVPEGEGLVKVCTGIASPLLAIACLFIPTAILYLGLDDQRPSQETAGNEQSPPAA